jgi:hypothetical protein
MSVIATFSNRLSTVVKYELEPTMAICRSAVIVNDAASTYKVGTVLGRTLTGGAATAVITGTGNGSIGTVTVGGKADTGVYTLRINTAATNAGAFSVFHPKGYSVGNGNVAVAFSGGGLSFTLADGATDFVVGDTIAITVTGTYKYKKAEFTATDGSDRAKAVFIGDVNGASYDLSVTATTDTTVLALTRGPVQLARGYLTVGAGTVGTTFDSATKLAQLYGDLDDLNIQTIDTVNT